MYPVRIGPTIIMSLILCSSLLSCRDAEKIEGIPEQVIEPVRLTFTAPSPMTNTRHLNIRIRSVGTAPILIESLSLSENDDVKELSLASVDDWHTKLTPIPAGEFRIVKITWTAVDSAIDTGQVTIRHMDGLTVIPIRTPLLTPQLSLSSSPQGRSSEQGISVDFGAVPKSDVGQIKLTVMNQHVPSLAIDHVCLLDERGACRTEMSRQSAAVRVCRGHNNDIDNCVLPAPTAPLEMGLALPISVLFRPGQSLASPISERLRIRSNDKTKPDMYVQINGTVCERSSAEPVCGNCGNGIVDLGEACDDGNLDQADTCRNSCQLNRCGDGLPGPNEDCDDGNQVNGDGCDNNCTVTECEWNSYRTRGV